MKVNQEKKEEYGEVDSVSAPNCPYFPKISFASGPLLKAGLFLGAETHKGLRDKGNRFGFSVMRKINS